MTATIEINVNLWEQFSDLAEQQRKRPNRLLEKILVEYLSTQNEVLLDNDIRRQMRKNGFKERQASAIAKCHRNLKDKATRAVQTPILIEISGVLRKTSAKTKVRKQHRSF